MPHMSPLSAAATGARAIIGTSISDQKRTDNNNRLKIVDASTDRNQDRKVLKNLQDCLNEFETSLRGHVISVVKLRRGLGEARGLVSTLKIPYNANDGISSSSAPTETILLRPLQGQADRDLKIHVHELLKFLDSHERSIEILTQSLDSSFGGSNCRQGRIKNSSAAQCLRVQPEDHSARYSMIVVMSTFTAGLIVAFLQLMYSMLPPLDDTNSGKQSPHDLQTYAFHYHMGFGFGLVGLVWNLCVAIVAGANTIAESSAVDYLADSDGDEQETPDHAQDLDTTALETTFSNGQYTILNTKVVQAKRRYDRRSVAFAFAQFLGAAMFAVSVGVLYYPLHSGHVLAWVPVAMLVPAFSIAAWDLYHGVGRKRKDVR